MLGETDGVEARPVGRVAPGGRIRRRNNIGAENGLRVGIDGNLISREGFRLAGILISAKSGTIRISGTSKIGLQSRQYEWAKIAEVSAALGERRNRLIVIGGGALKAEFFGEEEIGFVLIRVEQPRNVNRAANGTAKVVSAVQRRLGGLDQSNCGH